MARTWQEKITSIGEFEIDDSIVFADFTILDVRQAAIRLKDAAGNNRKMVTNDDYDPGNGMCQIIGGIWDLNGQNQTQTGGRAGVGHHNVVYWRNEGLPLCLDDTYGNKRGLICDGMHIYNGCGDILAFDYTFGGRCAPIVKDCEMRGVGSTYGFAIYVQFASDTVVQDCYGWITDGGMYVQQCTAIQVNGFYYGGGQTGLVICSGGEGNYSNLRFDNVTKTAIKIGGASTYGSYGSPYDNEPSYDHGSYYNVFDGVVVHRKSGAANFDVLDIEGNTSRSSLHNNFRNFTIRHSGGTNYRYWINEHTNYADWNLFDGWNGDKPAGVTGTYNVITGGDSVTDHLLMEA